MYEYTLPKPILFPLSGQEGFELRKKVVEFVEREKKLIIMQ